MAFYSNPLKKVLSEIEVDKDGDHVGHGPEIFRKHFVFSFLHFNIFSLPTRDFTPAMLKLSNGINLAFENNPNDPDKANSEINKCFLEHYTGKDSYVKKTVKLFRKMDLEFSEGIFKLRHADGNKYLIHNIFGEIESIIFNGTFHNIAKTSVEHYMPQESETSWDIPKSISRQHENRLGNILIIDADLNGKLQNKSHIDKMEILRGHNSNSNFTNEFVEINDNGSGIYNFGKITKDHLSNSDPFEAPSEIDKRTIQIGEHIKQMYITDMTY